MCIRDRTNFYIEKHFVYDPWHISTRSYNDFKKQLKYEISRVLKNIIVKANGRTIAIPLSAGLDSRLIASGLKHLNYNNVKCFSYGLKNNFESNASKSIANKLKYDWGFVEINQTKAKMFFSTPENAWHILATDTKTDVSSYYGGNILEYTNEKKIESFRKRELTEIKNLENVCYEILEPVRAHFDKPITITSGYRSEALCEAIGSKKTSQHAKGQAVDFEIAGVPNIKTAYWIQNNCDFDQLILEFYKKDDPAGGWVHAVSYTHLTLPTNREV